MIRINLLSGKQKSQSFFSPKGEAVVLSESQRNAEFLKRIALMPIIPVILIAIESQLIPAKKEQLAIVQRSLSELASFNNRRDETRLKIKARKEEYEKYETQLNALKKISQSRFYELKVLDRLQDIIPEHTWVTDVQFAAVDATSGVGGVTDLELRLSTTVELEADQLFEVISSMTDYFEEVLPIGERSVRPNNPKIKDFKLGMKLRKNLILAGESINTEGEGAASSAPSNGVKQ